MSAKRPPAKGARRGPASGRTGEFSRYDLYELTVQNPAALVPFLRAVHGRDPRVLGEDFCGSGALSKAWVAAVSGGRAIAVDLDPDPLERIPRTRASAIKVLRKDVRRVSQGRKADLIFVGNFSIGELHDRRELIRYLRVARARLSSRGERGVFVCDTYGGETAFTRGGVTRMHPGPSDDPTVRIRYTWQQREADPLSGLVENALHYRVERAGTVVQELSDAFVYRWRLWSVPELRDAMREAGFKSIEVYAKLADAKDAEGNHYVRPLGPDDELDDSFIVCVVGRK